MSSTWPLISIYFLFLSAIPDLIEAQGRQLRRSLPHSNFDSVADLYSRPEKENLTRIAFGSCHKTKYQSRDVWHSVAQLQPNAFLWTGDAVYTSSNDRKLYGSVGALERAFLNMTGTDSPYSQFKNANDGPSFVEGVWDDHDFGVNDGGRHTQEKESRQKIFLDFLDVATDSPRRKHRKGVYSAHKLVFLPLDSPGRNSLPSPSSKIISVIFLDTRYHRDNHMIPSIGGVSWVPFGDVIAAFTRALTSGMFHTGDILGEKQWTWFESVLKEAVSSSELTIIVSGIQIFTSNPLVESWTHFPRSRKRLIEILRKYDLGAIQFISGDVHYAELSALPNGHVIETTSSGLTHSCTTPFWGIICPDILSAFGYHRENVAGRSSYTDRNFGSIDVDWGKGTIVTSIHDAATGTKVATFKKSFSRGASNINAEMLLKWTEETRRLGSQMAGKILACIIMAAIAALAIVISLFQCRLRPERTWQKTD